MSLNLNRLNPRQREAVLHVDGPLLVLAGAGSGKTSTMAYRIAHLIAARNIPGFNLLGLSFTNKAARELKDRVYKLVSQVAGPNGTKGLTVTTFHSLCVRILREHAPRIGFQTNFTILDQSDQKDILRQIFRNVRIDDRKFDLDFILFEIGQAKSRLLSADEAEARFFETKRLSSDYADALAASYRKYHEQLRALNAMDFDDLLIHALDLLENHAEVRHHYNARFRHILVDEYQDTNPTQFRLLRLLTERQQNLCVVGDDDQSIYSWRGADASHILEFAHHFPNARIVTLDQNYRSTGTILDAANAVIKNNSKRHPKTLWSDRGSGSPLTEVIVEDDRGEGEYVALEILRQSKPESGNRPWKDFAVLYRSNAQSRIFEEALRRNGVPYKIVGGMSFLDRKEVKDVLSYWRLIANPRDDASLRRIMNWPSRGIGKGGMEALNEAAFKAEAPLYEMLPRTAEFAPRAAAGAGALHALIEGLRVELDAAGGSPELWVAWARKSLERIGVKRAIEEEDEDPVKSARRYENVEELVHSLGQIKPEEGQAWNGFHALQEFLHRMTLQAQEEAEDEKERKEKDENQVTLLTLHGAKGLEYPVVFLVGCEEGFLPHKRTIEEAVDFSEERRLCYVGITRARDHLFLTRARHRVRYGKPVPRNRSRFLEEIPKEVIVHVDQSHGPTSMDSPEARAKHEEAVKDHLAGIRAMLTRGKA